MTGMDFSGAAERVRSMVADRRPDRAKQDSALVPNVLRDNLIAESESRTKRFRTAAEDQPTVEYDVKHTAEDGTETTERKSFGWGAYGELLRDVARASFDWDEPELAGPNAIKQSHKFNRDVLAEYMNSEAFRESRPYTRDNETESLFGAVAASNVLKEAASEIAGHIASSEQVRQAENSAQSAEQMLDGLREQAKGQHEAGVKIDPNLIQQIKDAVKGKRAAQGQLAQAQAQASALRPQGIIKAREIGTAMAEAAAEAVDAVGNLPGLAAGAGQNLTPDQRIELAEKWSANRQLKKIAQMTGRLIRDMRFKRQARTKNVKIEPTGITTGRDLDVMLPHEMARAYMPQLRPLFIKDWAARSLLQYEMSGKTPAGKGPIVYVYDGSGSMAGEKFVWASSLGLALFSIAQREKRTFAAVQFSGGGAFKTWLWPKLKQVAPDEVLDFATFFFGGGTDIGSGMAEAQRIIATESGFKSADIILVTDGWCGYSKRDEEVRNALRRMEVRIHGISILSPEPAYLMEMCDTKPVDVFDLAGSNEATDQLAQNIT